MANKYQDIVEKLGGRRSSKSTESYVQPLREHFAQIEHKLGFSLPADYREFLRNYSGYGFPNVIYPVVKEGKPQRETVFLFNKATLHGRTLADSYHSACENFDSVPAELYPGLRLVRNVGQEEKEIKWPRELLPIACDMGGNQICLALFGLRPGAIFFWVNAPGDGDNVYLVADSFDEFMHLLRKDEA